jgi:hypothetical protein
MVLRGAGPVGTRCVGRGIMSGKSLPMALRDHRWLAAPLAASLAVCAAQDAGQPPPRDRGLAAIAGSRSTNADGFRILVERSGRTQSMVVPRDPGRQPVELPETIVGKIPADLAGRLYADLDAAWPLSSLPKQHCLKSASFGVSLTISFDNQKTPDLSCGGGKNPRLQALVEDARQIVSASRNQPPGGR